MADVAQTLINLVKSDQEDEIMRVEAIRSLAFHLDIQRVTIALTEVLSGSYPTSMKLEAVRALGGPGRYSER